MRELIVSAMVAAVVLTAVPVRSAPVDRPVWDPPPRFAGEPDFEYDYFPMKPRRVAIECARMLKGESNIFIRYANMTREFRGCSECPPGKRCRVITIDRPAYGTTPEDVLHHEWGHMKGWSRDHSN